MLEFFTTSTRNLLEPRRRQACDITLRCPSSAPPHPGERLPPGEARSGSVDRGSSIPYSIVRSTQFLEFTNAIADAATDGSTVRLAHVLYQPIAANDTATAVARVSVGSPLNGIVEVAGPEPFRMSDLVCRVLHERGDPREVTPDPSARYFGAPLGERTLLPGDDADLGETRFDDWLRDWVNRQVGAGAASGGRTIATSVVGGRSAR